MWNTEALLQRIFYFPFQSLMQQKVITTILRTLPTNILSVAKPSIAGASGTNTVSVSGSPKQTFVIAAPGAGKGGTSAKIISSVPKLGGNPSIIVSSAATGAKSILSTQGGDKGISTSHSLSSYICPKMAIVFNTL